MTAQNGDTIPGLGISMKKLFTILFLILAWVNISPAPTYYNPYTTNSNPGISAQGLTQLGVTPFNDVDSGAYSRWVAAGVVLTNGSPTAFDGGYFGEAATLRQYGLLYCYYIINTNVPFVTNVNLASIGISVGSDIYHQVKMGKVFTNNPTATKWDGGYVQGPFVYSEFGTNFLFYFGATNRLGFEQGTPEIGMAYSTTPSNWTRLENGDDGRVLTHGAPNTWDCGFMAKPFVMKYNGLYYLFYNGQKTNVIGEQIGFAVSTNFLLDPWHKYAGNPVLPNSGGSLVSDPQILLDKNGTFIMTYTVGRHLNTAWSKDLTNWFPRGECIVDNYYLTNSSPDYGSLFNPFVAEFSQSPCLVNDGGPKILVDNRTGNNGWIFALTPSALGQGTPSNFIAQSFLGKGDGISFPTPFLPWHAIGDNNYIPPDESAGFSNNVNGITFVDINSGLTNATARQVFAQSTTSTNVSILGVNTANFPTNLIPAYVSGQTNAALVVLHGVPRIVATNGAAGGWMTYTNWANGQAGWSPLIP